MIIDHTNTHMSSEPVAFSPDFLIDRYRDGVIKGCLEFSLFARIEHKMNILRIRSGATGLVNRAVFGSRYSSNTSGTAAIMPWNEYFKQRKQFKILEIATGVLTGN